jgi:membrane alanyl aminopeptidase
MEYYCLDAIRPEWKVWQEFFVSDCYYALTRDTSPDIQAVKQAVNHPSEIETLFDPAIVYAKGSHLMFMLMRLMGEQNFLKGLRDYFEKHQYQNTTGNDLWVALQPYTNFNVSDFMNQWITRPGFPIIEGEKQERFYLDGRSNQESWPLVQVSDDMTGHYIIGLTSEELQAKLAHFSELNQEQQLRLLIDQSLLLRTPRGDLPASLDLLMHFRNETSFAIWSIIMSILGELKIYCPAETPAETNLKSYIRELISPQIARLGVSEKTEDTDDDKKLRESILSLAVYADDRPTILHLTEQYNIYITDALNFAAISPELLLPYLEAEFKNTKEARFKEYLNLYVKASSPTIKSLLLDIITDAKHEEHLQTLLDMLSDTKVIRLQDHSGYVRDLLANHSTRKATFDWLYQNWDYLKNAVDGKSLDIYPKIMARFIRNQSDFALFQKFAKRFENDPALFRIIKIGIYEIENRLVMLDKNTEKLHQKLEKYLENH